MEVPGEVLTIISVLRRLGFRVFLIGARALAYYGIVRGRVIGILPLIGRLVLRLEIL